MKLKTISGHYDTTISLDHNNRVFSPSNVDPCRTRDNFNVVRAGFAATDDFPEWGDMRQLWADYHALTETYWLEYKANQEVLYQRIRQLERDAWIRRHHYQREDNFLIDLVKLLLMPLIVATSVYREVKLHREINELKIERFINKIRAEDFRYHQVSLREALRAKDREKGTLLLQQMDGYVRMSERIVQNWADKPPRFATIEEIYDKVFEPGFQGFQATQRACRRYNGTYLQQVRERRQNSIKTHGSSEKNRSTAEAIVVAKLYSARPSDRQDVIDPGVLKALDWEVLERLALAEDEARASALNDRSYAEFKASYDEYVRRFRPCENSHSEDS